MTRDRQRPGSFCIPGQVSMLITRGDGLVTGPQAAGIAGVKYATFRSWVHRGHIEARGLGDHGEKLYHPDDVARTEKAVRDNGLRTSGVDPRTQRTPAVSAA